MQWLKIYDRNDDYCKMVDKYQVRQYIAEKIGIEYLIPCLGMWKSADEIDYESLPNKFVLKCTHDSGSVKVCQDKSKFDCNTVNAFLNKRLKQGTFYYGREWPYKDLKPHIIAEQYLIDDETQDLRDYKIHCFNGVPKVVLVCSERHKSGLKEDWFTIEWDHLPIHRPTHMNNFLGIKKPVHFDDMLRIAEILSQGIPFVRIDFYEVNGKVYFSEITFFPTSGFTAFIPDEYDKVFGDWIQLPAVK